MVETRAILIVEDEPNVRGLLADMLEANGYKCIVASNAADAVRIIEAEVLRFDLLLSDVMMPGTMSGVDLAMRIRQMDPETRVLLISGYIDEKLSSKLAATPFRTLPKPFRQAELLGAVKQELDRTVDANVKPLRTPKERSS